MFSKKTSLLLSGVIFLVLIMAGCSLESGKAVNQEDSEITLKLTTWHPSESDAATEYLKPFMEKITNLTDGQVQFEFYPGEQLGKAADALSLTESGVADIAHFSPSFTPSEMMLSATVPGIPGLYESTSQGARAFSNIAQQSPILEKDFLNYNVRPISLGLTPFYDIFNTKKQIKVPEDLKGLKIRAAGGVFSKIVSDLGATPVQIPTADIYSAYNSGVIDGLHFSSSNMGTFSLEELTKYSTPGLNLGSGINGLIINEEVYQGLPKETQEIIMQVGEEMGRKYTEFEEAKNQRVYEEFHNSGDIDLYELSEDQKEKWQQFYDKFQKKITEEQNSEEFNKAMEMFLEELDKQK